MEVKPIDEGKRTIILCLNKLLSFLECYQGLETVIIFLWCNVPFSL